MNYETWAATFKPMDNHLDSNASYSGKMFETYGDEFEFLKTIDPSRIWTLRSSDGSTAITAGLGWVNRLGYFVTTRPWSDGVEDVALSEESECECFLEDGWVDKFGQIQDGNPDCQECEGSGQVEKWPD